VSHEQSCVRFINLYQFVGSFRNIANHTHELLSALNLWEQFGATGWGRGARSAIFESNTSPHQTLATDKMSTYYTDELLAVVKDAYRADYELLARTGLDAGARVDGRCLPRIALQDLDPRLTRKAR
jgi:hypothetical protein